MLRIHVDNASEEVTLRLEGKLVYPWTTELALAWGSVTNGLPDGPKTRIDINAVSYADDCGMILLGVMKRWGCEIFGSGVVAKGILEDLGGQDSAGRASAKSCPAPRR